jgi:Phage integrase, N-terminal SAM-like domain
MPVRERLCERSYGRWLACRAVSPGRIVVISGTGLEVIVVIVTTSTTVARADELFTTDEETALVGFLAGHSGLTREAYALDLRQYVQWSTERAVPLFGARRSDIESFGRYLECLGRARATIARRLCTIASFYRYAEEEGLIPVAPAVHVRRPRLDDALLSWLARNGLRVSEALGATCRRRPATRIRVRPCVPTVPGSLWTATPPTSSKPSSPAQPDNTPNRLT